MHTTQRTNGTSNGRRPGSDPVGGYYGPNDTRFGLVRVYKWVAWAYRNCSGWEARHSSDDRSECMDHLIDFGQQRKGVLKTCVLPMGEFPDGYSTASKRTTSGH